jgi:hypothetical protein
LLQILKVPLRIMRWWFLKLPLAVVYAPFWLAYKIVQGLWKVAEWPFTRGGAADLERRIMRESRQEADRIEKLQEQGAEERRQKFLSRAGGSSGQRGSRSKQGYRRKN